MSIIGLVIALIVIGVLLWLVNTQLGSFIAPPILKIINIVVIIAVVLWVLSLFFDFGSIGTIGTHRIGR
jgi:hypothetical protein